MESTVTNFLRAIGVVLMASACTTAQGAEPRECLYDKGETLTLRFLPSGLPLVDGAINDAPITLLLDTGASQTNLLPRKLAELNVFVAASKSNASGVGGKLSRSITRLKTFDVGPIHLDKPYMFVLNNLHPKLADQFDALLGMETLALNDFEVDIAQGKLTVFKGLCPKGKPVAWDPAAFALPMNRDRPDTSPAQFSVSVQGHTVKAFFDTGAARSSLDARLAETLGLAQAPGGEVRYSVGAGSQRAPMWKASVKDIAIGAEKFDTATLYVKPANPGQADPQFLIGLDYLKGRRLLFLPGQERILIKSAAGAPFARSSGQ